MVRYFLIITALALCHCERIREKEEKYPSGVLRARYTYFTGENGFLMLDGEKSVWSEEGVLLETTGWVENQRHGKSREWYLNSQKKRESDWRHGKQTAVEKTWYANGQLKCQSVWEGGIKNGPETCWHSNGHKKSYAFFVNGIHSGGIKTWASSGTFLGGGQRMETREDGGIKIDVRELLLEYESGLPALRYSFFEKAGGEPKMHGKLQSWYPTGQVKKITHYSRGAKNGVELEYYPNGKKRKKTEWFGGVKDGKETEWWQEAELMKSEIMYRRGRCNGLARRWYSNGNPRQEEFYINDTLNFKSIHWYPNGSIKAKYSYKKGLLHGEVVENYEDGSPRRTCFFAEGKKTNRCETFNRDIWVEREIFKSPHPEPPARKLRRKQLEKELVRSGEGCASLQFERSRREELILKARDQKEFQELDIQFLNLQGKLEKECGRYESLSLQYENKVGPSALRAFEKKHNL